MGRKPSDYSDKLWVKCRRGQEGTGGDRRTALWLLLTVGVVAVGVPPLAPVEANSIINNSSLAKATVGSCFYYGIPNSALGHPASSTHVETCSRGKMSQKMISPGLLLLHRVSLSGPGWNWPDRN